MISRDLLISRRNSLKQLLKTGVVVLLGNRDVPFNYAANHYDYRQDSNFLYFFGIDRAGVSAVIDIDNNRETLFGDDAGISDIIWTGEQETVNDAAADCGVESAAPYGDLQKAITVCLEAKREIHFLPFYRNAGLIEMGELLNIPISEVNQNVSSAGVKAVIQLRSRKDDEEIAELTAAVDIARDMHVTMMQMAKSGITEQEIAGQLRGIAFSRGTALSFPPIISVDGQILHNLNYANSLANGRMLLADAGAENNAHYVSDISRTVPVGGKFSTRQKEIYEIVLKANAESIEQIRPGMLFRDIHLNCARIIADGLKSLGLMKGDMEEAVAEGAQALFFPHGLGHMLGLDAHDMEGLGEDHVGYNDEIRRASQFGLASLRLGKKLEERFVVTIEPGIYFIPLLIEQWKQAGKWSRFINFEKVETYTDFGGVRIEDNIVVTSDGQLNLSREIPKSVAEIESVMSQIE